MHPPVLEEFLACSRCLINRYGLNGIWKRGGRRKERENRKVMAGGMRKRRNSILYCHFFEAKKLYYGMKFYSALY